MPTSIADKLKLTGAVAPERNDMKSLSWKAVRNGPTYCAPACGRGCTHAEFVAANKAADDVVRQLGAGWKKRVWENLGWHWTVATAKENYFSDDVFVSISPTLRQGYCAEIHCSTQFFGYGSTPQIAVKKAYALAKKWRDKAVEDIALIERSVCNVVKNRNSPARSRLKK